MAARSSLDEIGELPPEAQVSLLRVSRSEDRRVGSIIRLRWTVRVLAATNRISRRGGARHIREELFYRLNVFPIPCPPLRERAEDIPILVEYPGRPRSQSRRGRSSRNG